MVETVKVEIKGMNGLEKFMREVQPKITRAVDGTNISFMKALRKSAKLRAPKDTGELRNSIRLLPAKKSKNTKIWKLVVDSPHAGFQEHGFKPHYAPIYGSRKMAPGIYMVSKFTPFLEPALKHNLLSFNAKLNQAVGGAIKK